MPGPVQGLPATATPSQMSHAFPPSSPPSLGASPPTPSPCLSAARTPPPPPLPQTFIKAVNYQHLLPTRYTLEVDLKGVVTPDVVDNSTKKVEANKEAKKLLEEKFKSGKNRWFFSKLRWVLQQVGVCCCAGAARAVVRVEQRRHEGVLPSESVGAGEPTVVELLWKGRRAGVLQAFGKRVGGGMGSVAVGGLTAGAAKAVWVAHEAYMALLANSCWQGWACISAQNIMLLTAAMSTPTCLQVLSIAGKLATPSVTVTL